jgi:hypothetical protein
MLPVCASLTMLASIELGADTARISQKSLFLCFLFFMFLVFFALRRCGTRFSRFILFYFILLGADTARISQKFILILSIFLLCAVVARTSKKNLFYFLNFFCSVPTRHVFLKMFIFIFLNFFCSVPLWHALLKKVL